ncbi:hypothetical protein EDEG_00392 [Edhazardia aedis USNM 41457]|uniref:RecF/RecN/SMC N-terminal domain-containing protein n=1 Tax=Edhazardia aedis (strain USNM 41457) TaxID=1003232 RepID=J9DGF1_EDHAE|nr:hypothetical protein EDEG_00392 [Edhazardia aedis USNM 41457]|eukprot:EJW01675.1 hypothetical protein EDEG_00392 [Edhazardia aedis USNM 41457]
MADLTKKAAELKKKGFENEYQVSYYNKRREYDQLESKIEIARRNLNAQKENLKSLEKMRDLHFEEDVDCLKQVLEVGISQLNELNTELKRIVTTLDDNFKNINQNKIKLSGLDDNLRNIDDRKYELQARKSNLESSLSNEQSIISRKKDEMSLLKTTIKNKIIEIMKKLHENEVKNIRNNLYDENYLRNKCKLIDIKNYLILQGKETICTAFDCYDKISNINFNGFLSENRADNISDNATNNNKHFDGQKTINTSNNTIDPLATSLEFKTTNLYEHSNNFDSSNNSNRNLNSLTTNYESKLNPSSQPFKKDPATNPQKYSRCDKLREAFECILIPKRIKSLLEIEKIIRDFQEKIEVQKKAGTEEEIKEEIQKLILEKERKEITITSYENDITNLLENTKKRINKREKMKLKECKRANEDFRHYMMKRKYNGKLIFNHEIETLEIKVKLQGNKISGDKNTLSGGERSYAAVCFLLSLWPSVCCPIKILDEFDVYMDNMNRKCAINLITDYINKSKNLSQVLLISPLDTSLVGSKDCEVIVLEPPQRKEKI